MPTKVTVDAHAGWPVFVVTKRGENLYEQFTESYTVQPNTKQAFYIHSGLQILYIGEQPRQ